MSLQDVLVDELRDLYSAENQLVKALPKIAKGTTDAALKTIFTEHLEETKGHVVRLRQVFELLGKKPTGEHCMGMEGLVKEGQEQLEKDEEGALKDACLIGAALRVEHYEQAGYTTAISLAKQMGQTEIVGILTETFNEEVLAGKKVLSQATPILKQASAEDDGGDKDTKPKSAKEKTSERKSKKDEADAVKASKAA